MAKIVFDLPLAMLLLPAYLLALAMTVVSAEEYVNLAWDSAGVTAGPVTVPLVLALGLGLGKSVNAVDGFGVLGVTVNAEKEVIYIVAPSEQADLIFECAYVAGKLDTPGMGMIYVSPLEKMATHIPPAVAERFLGD